jgi:hypothetical protein
MSEVTQLLAAAQGGDPSAPAHLLPLDYDELPLKQRTSMRLR